MNERHELARRRLKFDPGHVLATPGAIVAIEFARASARELLHRHLTGDWGDLSDDDQLLNEEALESGGRILSAYMLADGETVWIITEADRSATTFLTPEEY